MSYESFVNGRALEIMYDSIRDPDLLTDFYYLETLYLQKYIKEVLSGVRQVEIELREQCRKVQGEVNLEVKKLIRMRKMLKPSLRPYYDMNNDTGSMRYYCTFFRGRHADPCSDFETYTGIHSTLVDGRLSMKAQISIRDNNELSRGAIILDCELAKCIHSNGFDYDRRPMWKGTRNYLFIQDLDIDDRLKGQGIGRNLLDLVEIIAKDNDCNLIFGCWSQETPYLKDDLLRRGYKNISKHYYVMYRKGDSFI